MSFDEVFARLASDLPQKVRRGVVLAPHTTYRLGGPAGLYVEASDPDDLERVGEALASAPELPVLVLGRGSNLVVSDAGFPGLVIHLSSELAAIDVRGEEVVVGAATSLPQLANWSARRGLTGVEFGVGVPGSAGGAVRMNAGAHGGDIASVLVSARLFDLRSGTMESLGREALGFSYRHSAVGDDQVVIDATLRLAPAEPDVVRSTIAGYRAHRASTQPGAAQNAGSVFKNPPGDFAARLVESAGMKGFRVGGAEVSTRHSNFFIAHEGATASEVFVLVQEVRKRVHEQFGIDLEPEVTFVGNFEHGPGSEAQ